MLASHKLDWLLMGFCTMVASLSSQSYASGGMDAETLKQVLCFSFGGIGSVASGYIGSVVFPIKNLTFRTCWVVNFLCGFLLAPMVTYAFIGRYPHIPIPIAAAAASLVIGALGVKTLQYAWPVIMKFYARKFGSKNKSHGEED